MVLFVFKFMFVVDGFFENELCWLEDWLFEEWLFVVIEVSNLFDGELGRFFWMVGFYEVYFCEWKVMVIEGLCVDGKSLVDCRVKEFE